MTKEECEIETSKAIMEMRSRIAELEKENAELKKENTELKTRWQCRNKYMCIENGKAVPCYIYYGCLNCQFLLEKEVKDSEVEE